MTCLAYLRKLGVLRYLIFTLPFVLCSVALADQKSAHKEGKDFAKEQTTNHKQAMQSYKASDVPGFRTDRPPEAGMDVAQLANRKASILDKNEHAGFLAKTVNERPFIKIDPLNDPVITHAQEAAANPEATISRITAYTPDGSEPTRHTCEESRASTDYMCSQTRHVVTEVPTVRTHIVTLEVRAWRWRRGLGRNVINDVKLDQSYVHPKGRFVAYTNLKNPLPASSFYQVESVKLLNGNHRATLSDNGDLWFKTYRKDRKRVDFHLNLDVEITDRPVVQNGEIKEHIEDNCGSLKERASKGFCKFVKEVIKEGAGPRDFNDHAIHRPWWKKESTYQCHYPSLNNCNTYRQQGCDQIGSTCKSKVGDTCAVAKQTYLCRKKGKTCSQASEHSAPFCIDGNCSEPTYDANKDMMEAVSRLSVLKDIQGEISKDDLHIFKGGSKSCKNYITSFKNCCGSGKGWGKSLGLTNCDGDEKILAKARSQNLCRKIGTYCSEKILGVCISEKTTFCCFPTRMARVFHEQGRPQLGLGWGDKHHPDCRGLTIEELTRIDFSRLDLSELYRDIAKNMKKPDLKKIDQGIRNRVENMVIDTDKNKGVKVG